LSIDIRTLVESALLTLLQDYHPFAEPFLFSFAAQLCDDYKTNPRLPDPQAAIRSFLDLVQSSSTNSRLYDLINSNANLKSQIISAKNMLKGATGKQSK